MERSDSDTECLIDAGGKKRSTEDNSGEFLASTESVVDADVVFARLQRNLQYLDDKQRQELWQRIRSSEVFPSSPTAAAAAVVVEDEGSTASSDSWEQEEEDMVDTAENDWVPSSSEDEGMDDDDDDSEEHDEDDSSDDDDDVADREGADDDDWTEDVEMKDAESEEEEEDEKVELTETRLRRNRSTPPAPRSPLLGKRKRKTIVLELDELPGQKVESPPPPPPSSASPSHPHLVTELKEHQVKGVDYILGKERKFIETKMKNREIAEKIDLSKHKEGEEYTGPRTEKCARGVVMGDDMGQGKTIQFLTVVCRTLHCSHEKYGDTEDHTRKGHRQTLVVAPKGVISTWVKECERHFKGLRAVAYTRKMTLSQLKRYHIVVIGYSQLNVQFKDLENSPIYQRRWWRIILDESHMIRNIGTSRLAAVNELRDRTILRHTCSGTPAQNEPLDLYTTFSFIDAPGLEKQTHWVKGTPEWRYRRCVELLREHMIRRVDDSTLPALSIYRKTVRMSKEESKLYADKYGELEKDVKKYDEVEGREERFKARSHILAVMQHLRSICSYPALYNRKLSETPWASENCTKFRELRALYDRYVEDDPKVGMLVFSQFSTTLNAALPMFEEHAPNAKLFIYTGEISSTAKRDRIIKDFQENTKNSPAVLFITTGAGGTGLTATRATKVVFLDWDYNPQKTKQALKRAHRIGQDMPVTVTFFESVAIDHREGDEYDPDLALETIETGIRRRCKYKETVFEGLMVAQDLDGASQVQQSLAGMSCSILSDSGDPMDSDYAETTHTMRDGKWQKNVQTTAMYGRQVKKYKADDASLNKMDGIKNMIEEGRHAIREIDEEEEERKRQQYIDTHRRRVILHINDDEEESSSSNSESDDECTEPSSKSRKMANGQGPRVQKKRGGPALGVTFSAEEIQRYMFMVKGSTVYSISVDQHTSLLSSTTYFCNLTHVYDRVVELCNDLWAHANQRLTSAYLKPRLAALYNGWTEEARIADVNQCTIVIKAHRLLEDIDLTTCSATTSDGSGEMLYNMTTPETRICIRGCPMTGNGSYFICKNAKIEECGGSSGSKQSAALKLSVIAVATCQASPYTIVESALKCSQQEIQDSLFTTSGDANDAHLTTLKFMYMCSNTGADLSTDHIRLAIDDWMSQATPTNCPHHCWRPQNGKCKTTLAISDVAANEATNGKKRIVHATADSCYVLYSVMNVKACPWDFGISLVVHTIQGDNNDNSGFNEFIGTWIDLAEARSYIKDKSGRPKVQHISITTDSFDQQHSILIYKAVKNAVSHNAEIAMSSVHVEVVNPHTITNETIKIYRAR